MFLIYDFALVFGVLRLVGLTNAPSEGKQCREKNYSKPVLCPTVCRHRRSAPRNVSPTHACHMSCEREAIGSEPRENGTADVLQLAKPKKTSRRSIPKNNEPKQLYPRNSQSKHPTGQRVSSTGARVSAGLHASYAQRAEIYTKRVTHCVEHMRLLHEVGTGALSLAQSGTLR